MPLTVGSRIAHYNVTALIGEGGKGELYRARDTKLDGGPITRLRHSLRPDVGNS